jgi:hypothetical protein
MLKLKENHKSELEHFQTELTQAQGQVTGKDHYI